MAIFTTTPDVSGLLPEDYGALIVQPVEQASIAVQVTTVIATDANTFRAPVVTGDGDAAWYGEGADLTGDGAEFDELEVTPSKVGRVVRISNELADDSSPEAAEQVGNSIARAIATQIDRAFFGNLASPAPKGLASLTDVPTVYAGTTWTNTDPFAEAITTADAEGGLIRFFVANPADYLAMLQIKKQTGSNEPLLGIDASQATRRTVLGVPLLSSKHVAVGTVWGIDPRFALTILRKDVTLETSRDVYFDKDMTAVKATMRAGFGFPHHRSLVKISKTARPAA
jgi:HK97 family phage major capsid protein